MQYVNFGTTGLQISRLGFGGIPIQRIDQPGTRELLIAAHKAGINYIDTARAYTVSEAWIGQSLEEAGLRDDFILATKCRALTKADMEAEIAKRNRPALPAAPRFDEAAMLELAAEIREAQQQYYRTYGRLCSRLITMSIPVFTALESRVYKQAPDRPFSGVRIGAQWERYFTERMTAALHSLDDRLPDEKNPAMLLLEYARAMSAR